MTTADETLAEIVRRGGSLHLAEDGRLTVILSQADHDELAPAIRENRAALLAQLLRPIRALYDRERLSLIQDGLSAERAAWDAWAKTLTWLQTQIYNATWASAPVTGCPHCGKPTSTGDVTMIVGTYVHAECYKILGKRFTAAARAHMAAAVGPEPAAE